MTYEVVVGNIGTVHTGTDHDAAVRCFWEYVWQSHRNQGRAAGENVTLYADGDIEREYARGQVAGGTVCACQIPGKEENK
jgi:hypothetical protein